MVRVYLQICACDSVVRQKCIVGSMSTPCPKLFILSSGRFTIAVETADQELYPRPYGFTSSSPPWPSLPHLSLSHYLLPDSFIPLTPHSTSSLPSSFAFFHLSFFCSHYSVYLSRSLVLNSHCLTFYFFLSLSFPLAYILSSATPLLLTKIIMRWLCRMFMFVSLKPAPVAFWKTAIILVSRQRLLSVPCARVSIHPHTCVNACVHLISSECCV